MGLDLPILTPAPLMRRPARAGSLMWRVVLALTPAALLGALVYGLPAALVLLAAIGGSLAGEALGHALWRRGAPLRDGSAMLSGLLLALILPPGLAPGWAFLGGALGLLVGRQFFGGLGLNLLNPALVGRLLLSLLAPAALQQAFLAPFWWRAGGWLQPGPDALPDPMHGLWEAGTTLGRIIAGESPVLPLGWPAGERMDLIHHAQDLLAVVTPGQLMWPTLPGMLGETSMLVLLPGLLWLFAARLVDWRIPAAALLVLPPALVLAAGGPGGQWLSMVLFLKGSGLLLLVCVIASDPVSTPLGQMAKLVFGLLVAWGLVLVLRFTDQSGGLYWVVLAAGMATPWLDRVMLPKGPR